jgi:hypothetical protein
MSKFEALSSSVSRHSVWLLLNFHQFRSPFVHGGVRAIQNMCACILSLWDVVHNAKQTNLAWLVFSRRAAITAKKCQGLCSADTLLWSGSCGSIINRHWTKYVNSAFRYILGVCESISSDRLWSCLHFWGFSFTWSFKYCVSVASCLGRIVMLVFVFNQVHCKCK